jgi:hypothetical protein
LPNAETVLKFDEESSVLTWDGKTVALDAQNVIYEMHTVTAGEVTAKKAALARNIDAAKPVYIALVAPSGSSIAQVTGIDYTVLESTKQISWDGFGLDTCVLAGDILAVVYYERVS